MLRELRPDLRIGFFMHIPFPPAELFMQLPRRAELLRGILGAARGASKTPVGADNFVRLTARLLGLAASDGTIEVDGRTVRAKAFPISIDVNEMELLGR